MHCPRSTAALGAKTAVGSTPFCNISSTAQSVTVCVLAQLVSRPTASKGHDGRDPGLVHVAPRAGLTGIPAMPRRPSLRTRGCVYCDLHQDALHSLPGHIVVVCGRRIALDRESLSKSCSLGICMLRNIRSWDTPADNPNIQPLGHVRHLISSNPIVSPAP